MPRKNLLHLGGKPLVQYTIEAVVGSKLFETILFSSEDQEMLAFAENFPEIWVEPRNHHLAGDKVKVMDLVKSIIVQDRFNDYDQIGLFLPTCPFRTSTHIREGLKMLEKNDFSVVSVCKKDEPLQLTVGMDPSTMILNKTAVLDPSPLVTGETRSQDFQCYYRVNGGFYISWLAKLRLADNFFQGTVKGYEMDSLASVDIDYQYDLDFANLLLERNYIS